MRNCGKRSAVAADVLAAADRVWGRSPVLRERVRGAAADPDLPLVRAIAKGDGAAAGELVRRRLPAIVAVAERMLGDRAEAEDVAQETFQRAWTHAGKWKADKAKFSTWLHRVAVNLCYDRLRKRARIADEPVSEERPDDQASPSEALESQQTAARVRGAIAALPERQRAAVALCHIQELSNAEAAQILDVSVEALESLLARARRTLRKTLASEMAV